MGKREEYRSSLRARSDWDAFLLAESGLPGPRGNLELADAVADEGTEELFRRYAGLDPVESRTGTAEEFLAFCGVQGYGRLLADGKMEYLTELKRYANDSRWRIREAVARGLQILGDADVSVLLDDIEPWAHGSPLEMRAAAAACCEPRLLIDPENAGRVLKLLDEITRQFVRRTDRKTDEMRTLRQGLAYCWSVAAAALPEDGLVRMERLITRDDPDVNWIMRENLKKNRLVKAAPERIQQLLDELQMKVYPLDKQ
jgi:hypothetical protein